MCGGPDQISAKSSAPSTSPKSGSLTKDMNNPTETLGTEYSFSSLLELAADNDVEAFKQCISSGYAISEIGLWYGYQRISRKMVLEQRTPLMVAAKYGSLDVVKFILSLSEVDVNCACGPDKSTALHCAASGGSTESVNVVKLLLLAGANPSVTDANGYRPFDVIVSPPNIPLLKGNLEELLSYVDSLSQPDLQLLSLRVRSNSPTHSASSERDSYASSLDSSSPKLDSKPNDVPVSSTAEKKEYPIDPSIPDINSSIYATDEFRMFLFKVRPCSRAYSHDWTECPFVHPGENARRRDPRKFHYSCVPCPDFRKGSCKHGDLCEYAHGVFECWLHPAQYRTRLCKDGTSCARKVCFFAHTPEELRPLYASTGSAVQSPRPATSGPTVMDMAAALNIFPGSPSAVSAMSPSPFTPPMSPSGNSMSHSSMAWSQQKIPVLHLPGSNLQTSRLRSSLNARDLPAEELDALQKMELQQRELLNDWSCVSHPHLTTNSANHSIHSRFMNPSNLDELFSAEASSPRCCDRLAGSSVYSPSQKTALFNQLQQQQSKLSPIKTGVFSPKNVDHLLLQASFGVSSPGRMSQLSPRSVETLSPMSARLSAFAHREKQQLRSFSSRELGSKLSREIVSNDGIGSPVNSWSRWEFSNGEVDWSIQADELGRLRKSYSNKISGEEPDVSWVRSMVNESPSDARETTVTASAAPLSVEVPNSKSQSESGDHAVLGAWLEQLELDQIVA